MKILLKFPYTMKSSARANNSPNDINQGYIGHFF